MASSVRCREWISIAQACQGRRCPARSALLLVRRLVAGGAGELAGCTNSASGPQVMEQQFLRRHQALNDGIE